jgi:hypothetical protein
LNDILLYCIIIIVLIIMYVAIPFHALQHRYKEANTRLRKLLADERRSLQQVRLNYSGELRARTEMEVLLRGCVEDVRKEIARR